MELASVHRITRTEGPDEKRFNSVEHCLRFAFEMAERPICKTSSINSMRPCSNPSSELTPHDSHAQAGMIRLNVNMLPPMEKHMIIAYYSGNVIEKKHSMNYLVRWCGAGGVTSIQPARVIRALIEWYCGRKSSAIEIARAQNYPLRTVQEWRRHVFERLDSLYDRSHTMLRVELIDLIKD